jgi:hypothetical protein
VIKQAVLDSRKTTPKICYIQHPTPQFFPKCYYATVFTSKSFEVTLIASFNTITPQSMVCITAETLEAKNFTTMRPTLLSVAIPYLPEKSKYLEQNACGSNFKKSPLPSKLLSGSNNGQKCNFL